MTALSPAQVAVRLLHRFGFGPAAHQRADERPVASLLAQQPSPVPAVELGPEPVFDANSAGAQDAAQAALTEQIAAITDWWLDRMVTTDVPFVEKLTWFWHGHFATGPSMVRSARLLLAQNQTFRTRGAGSFTDLVAAMVVDPAMLLWLNGDENKVGAANENLGRELMELFTLGVGRYGEPDVKEAARALTGWTVDRRSGSARLDPTLFDATAKTVLGARIRGSTDLVNLLVGRSDSAQYVVSRIWSRFVSADPAPADAISRLAAAFGPDRNVRNLMTALAAEPAMTDSAAVLVKQPVEWAVGLMRALGVRPSTLPAADMVAVREGLRGLGQVPFDPPNVGGWPSGAGWLTTGSALGRLSLAQVVARNADLSAVGDQAASARAGAVAAMLGIDPLSERSAAALRTAGHDPETLVAVAACAPEYVVSK